MLIFILLFCLQHAYAGVLPAVPDQQERIFGGTAIDISQAPWTVAVHIVQSTTVSFRCGGSILTPKFVATSAWCLVFQRYIVRVGSSYHGSGGQVLDVRKYTDDFADDPFNNYIGLLQLAGNIIFGPRTSPLALPPQGQAVPYDSNATFTGWGYYDASQTIPSDLKQTTMKIWPKNRCKLTVNPETVFCAGSPKDNIVISPCEFDVGGPLVIDRTLIGISIYPIGCPDESTPSFMQVSARRDWIDKILKTTR